jgi:hypothetical protein
VGDPAPLDGRVAAEAAVSSLAPAVGVGSSVVVLGVPVVVAVVGRVVVEPVAVRVAGAVAAVPVGGTAVLVLGRGELVGRGEEGEVPVLRGLLDVGEGLGVGDGFGAAAGGGLLGAPPEPKAKPMTLPDGGSYSATPLLL